MPWYSYHLRMKALLFFTLFSINAWSASVADLEAQLKQMPDRLSNRVQLANAYFKINQFSKVVELLNPYTDQLDENSFLLLGSAYSSLKDHMNEVRVLTVMTSKKEVDHRWYMLLGQAHLKHASTLPQDKQPPVHTLAIQSLRRTLQLQPKFKPAYDLLLITFLQQRAHNEARELLAEGIANFGRRADLFRELCRIDSGDGFLVQAIDHCREAIKLAPTYPDNFVYLVQTMYDQGENEQAERNITAAARKFPQSEFVQWAAGTLFMKKKNYPVSARYFSTGLKADGNSIRCAFGLAQSLYETGDEETALPHFVKACAADKATFHTFLSAGAKLKQKGNTSLGGRYTQAAYACKN